MMSVPRSAREPWLLPGISRLNVDPLTIARVLIILEVVAIVLSTAAAVGIEILIFACFLGFGELRRRVLAAVRQPMVLMALLMYAMVAAGIVYSVAPFSESVDVWVSWRKILLLPLAAAVFTDPLWKRRLLAIFIAVVVLCALLSSVGYLLDMGKSHAGIVVHNWATQGMLFSVAFFACLVLARSPLPSFAIDRRLLIASAFILALNIILVTPGRSGYLAFIVLTMTFVLWGVPRKAKLLLLLLAPVLIISLLLVSPVSQERVMRGIGEISSYTQDEAATCMGVRIIAWKNTIALLKRMERPFFGYGTNGFETAYTRLLDERNGTEERQWQDQPIGDPHNQYLTILVEYGVAGFVLFLFFIGSFFLQPVKNPYYILGIGVLLAWCATSLFSGHFGTAIEGRFLFVWCGAMLSAAAGPEDRTPDPEAERCHGDRGV